MLRTSFSYDNFASLDSNDQTKNGKRGFDKNAYSLIKRIKPHHTNKKKTKEGKTDGIRFDIHYEKHFSKNITLTNV